MSSRSIEGENPLYLPQAKVFERCAALGPCLYVTDGPISLKTNIEIQISRKGEIMYDEQICIDQIKRKFEDLVDYLFRECDFANGCFLMTGTGLVPADDFTLHLGDEVRIHIDPIGTLFNTISQKS
jgi:2-dehydro-3-deoxy-D-arabinonate dehydratase